MFSLRFILSLGLVFLLSNCSESKFSSSAIDKKKRASSEIDPDILRDRPDTEKPDNALSIEDQQIECEKNQDADNSVFSNPGGTLPWGDHAGRTARSLGGAGAAEIAELVIEKCNFDISRNYWDGGFISGDKESRDAVCNLYGYARATNNFATYHHKSPDDNWIGYYKDKKFQKVYGAQNYNFGKNLTKVECIGKVAPKCKEFILNEKNIKCPKR
jgi:hypothetical protein